MSDSSEATASAGGSTETGASWCPRMEPRGWLSYHLDRRDDYEVHDGPCSVEDVYAQAGSVWMDLTCPSGDQRVRGGGDIDLADVFTTGATVVLHAEGDGAASWANLAINDANGELVVGRQDLSPAASDFSEFLAGMTFDLHPTDCEIEDLVCPKQEVAIDIAIGGENALLVSGDIAHLGGWRIYSNTIWTWYPGPSSVCPDRPQPHGSIGVYSPE